MEFHYIDTVDLPSDPNGSLGKLRRELMKAYNSNRRSTEKLGLLKKTLQHIITEINEGLVREVPIKKEEPKQEKHITKSKLTTSPVRGRKTNRVAKRTNSGK